ncbi:kinase-like domain-containing protein [Myxozyma melibiosi]|uniref:Kinase-like domain-containing protein n=1 Tax=Myxozyma melibiosi TaxID=54550 RepID=A0ABR1FA59_9ASCO
MSAMASPENIPLTLSDRFELLSPLGHGSFGTVSCARVRRANASTVPYLRPDSIVAIKSMKKPLPNPADYLRIREVSFLRIIPPHDNIVRAYEIFLDLSTNQLHIIMEKLEMNLYQYLTSRAGVRFSTPTARAILFQVVSAVQHIHSHGFFHRDIKPENVLVCLPPHGASHDDIAPAVKLSDFGHVREVKGKSPYTSYVSTRWYRAPELLLKVGHYGPEVDIWALGAMAFEIATLTPLFAGSCEMDQISKICEVVGSPDSVMSIGGTWQDADMYTIKLGFLLPERNEGINLLDRLLKNAAQCTGSDEGEYSSLSYWIAMCLKWDPQRRPSIDELIEDRYLANNTKLLRHMPGRSISPSSPRTSMVSGTSSTAPSSSSPSPSLTSSSSMQHSTSVSELSSTTKSAASASPSDDCSQCPHSASRKHSRWMRNISFMHHYDDETVHQRSSASRKSKASTKHQNPPFLNRHRHSFMSFFKSKTASRSETSMY